MMDVKALVEGYRDELVKRLGTLVSINSEEGTPETDAPFGAGPRDALQAALKMLAEDGFDTVNLDNYAGYAEVGTGKECIGIVGHLDVVPAHKEDGWNTDPFQMVEKNGVLYGRGVSDDKGAVVASMIALKVLKDMQVPLNKRIRLIMGTNEETGSKGLAYYVKKEGSVDYGFTPDGDFPCINGEKGMVSAEYHSKKTGIREIQGGTAKNIVCRTCSIVVDKCSFSKKKLTDWYNNNNIPFTVEDNDATIKITVTGVAAHERGGNNEIIAEPCDSVTESIERIADLLDQDNSVLQFASTPVKTVTLDTEIVEAYNLMREMHTSKLPVYEEGSYKGLVTLEEIAGWGIAKDPAKRTVNEILLASKDDKVLFLPRNSSITAVIQGFESSMNHGTNLLAVIITEKGSLTEKPLGIITVADLPKILKSFA